jgi:hypothetical protein
MRSFLMDAPVGVIRSVRNATGQIPYNAGNIGCEVHRFDPSGFLVFSTVKPCFGSEGNHIQTLLRVLGDSKSTVGIAHANHVHARARLQQHLAHGVKKKRKYYDTMSGNVAA